MSKAKTKHIPIHREAREAAERALAALNDLRAADPYVHAALVFGAFAEPAPTRRGQLARIRERAHALKCEAVDRTCKAIDKLEATRTATEVH